MNTVKEEEDPVKQSEMYRQYLTELETLNTMIELTQNDKMLLVENEQITPDVKIIELNRVTAIEELLMKRKEAKEQDLRDHKAKIPITQKYLLGSKKSL